MPASPRAHPNPPHNPDPLPDMTAAGAYLGTGPRFPRRLISQRRIRFVYVAGAARIRRSDLDAYLAAHTREAETTKPVPRKPGRKLTTERAPAAVQAVHTERAKTDTIHTEPSGPVQRTAGE